MSSLSGRKSLLTQASNAILIVRLDKAMREQCIGFPGDAIIGELTAHQHLEESSLEAPSGVQNDLVITLRLAMQVGLDPLPLGIRITIYVPLDTPGHLWL
jgi:hypothetical protein